MIELILQLAAHALAGLVLGAGWALLILSTRAFSRYQTPGWLVLACAGIAFLATLGVGTFVVPHADAPRLAAVAVAVVAGSQAARIIRASLHARDVHTELLLPDSELNRRKLPADRYILVVGANGSGKSAVVSGLLKALGSGGAAMGGWRVAGLAQRGGTPTVTVSTVPIARSQDRRHLWFWECGTLQDGDDLIDFADVDSVLVVLDPTRLEGMTQSFPQRFRPSGQAFDANALVAALSARSSSDGEAHRAWCVVTKPDLLRFSLDQELVTWPVQIGPTWRQQFREMPLTARRTLLSKLHVESALEPPMGFRWGAGHPVVIYSDPENGFVESFGHWDLLELLLNSE